jgi:hypothetical protein
MAADIEDPEGTLRRLFWITMIGSVSFVAAAIVATTVM